MATEFFVNMVKPPLGSTPHADLQKTNGIFYLAEADAPLPKSYQRTVRLIALTGEEYDRDSTNSVVLDEIQKIMSGRSWTTNDMDRIAELIRLTGREIEDAE